MRAICVERFLMIACSACALAACGRDNPASPGSHLAFGEWGADGVQLLASDSTTGAAVGCSGGTFSGDIPLDATGHFTANGSWQRFGGAFTSNGNAPMPAQLSGQVTGITVVFAVAVMDTVGNQPFSIGPSTAVFGRHANIILCP